jgi:hypothetical protein
MNCAPPRGDPKRCFGGAAYTFRSLRVSIIAGIL